MTPPIRRHLTAVTAAAALAASACSVPAAARAESACPAATVTVSTPVQLGSALAAAQPGDVIDITDGTYDGSWTASTPGTAEAPVWLCGGPGAVLTDGGTHGSYGLWLNGASYWHLLGFSVTQAQKGVVADAVTGVTIEGLTVHDVGDEGIHLRTGSAHNLVTGNTIYATGERRQKFGEGIYVGSSQGNWSVYTGGLADKSDYNVISGNTIYGTPAESIDVKEGTTGGTISGNTFDGSAMTGPDGEGADSWIDVKGNSWLITGNTGHHSPADGYQVHHNKLLKLGLGDWGLYNLFSSNAAEVDGPGYGFWVHDATVTYNVVKCGNTVSGAVHGFANVTCTP